MAQDPPKKRPSNEALAATGTPEERADDLLRVAVDDWMVLLEWQGGGKPTSSVERRDGFTLVHFDLPEGPLGEYRISVQQPFIDIYRSWAGAVDCWRGTELTSIALNYSFDTAANLNLPVICNYDRLGANRGVVGLLDHAPLTRVNQRPMIEQPPMQLLQTQFARSRKSGGFRETVVISREGLRFSEAIRRFMRFCRERQGIEPLPAPEWARDPVWCSWYSHLYTLTQRDVEAHIPLLKGLGFRTVLLDASWFKRPDQAYSWVWGDYRVEKSLFPDLRGLSRRVRDEGLKLMVWCSPLYVGAQAQSRQAMAPYCVLAGERRSNRLCPFCAESIAHAREVVERVMSDYELDGLKIDFMDKTDPPCADPAHDHGDGNFGAAMAEFMRELRDGILKVNPDAAIEYRIRYSTLASTPFANCHRGNDAPYDADYMRRENLFLRLFCEYPSAVWSDYAYWHAQEKPANVSLMLGQQVFSGGVPTLSVDLTRCGQEHTEVIGRWLAFYQEHRDALARAELTVLSADSVFSVSSLQDRDQGVAFALLAGQHIPARLDLGSGVRKAWVLNASAEEDGVLTLAAGGSSARVRIAGPGPVHLAI